MKPNTSIRYAVFLILLVLGQEVCAAHQVISQNEYLRKTKSRENNDALKGRSRQKRGYAIVLLAITLTVSAAGVGFEIFNKVKGCCGTFPDACRYAREVIALRKKFAKKTKDIDRHFLKAKNLKEDVVQANLHIQEMLNDLVATGRYQEDLIQALSPSTIKKFQNKWADIEYQLKMGNLTVKRWTYQEIDLQFKSYFDDIKTALGGMSSFISNGLSAVYTVAQHYYRRNSLNKMINKLSTGQSYRQLVIARHTKAGKILGLNDVGLDKFIKDTARSRVNNRFGSAKYAFFYHAYNVVGTLISVGFDVWRAIRSIKACEKKRDKVKKLRDDWVKADRDMDNIKIYATNYYNLLKNKGWKYVKGNLTNPNLIKTLTSLNTMIKAAKPQTSNLTTAAAIIERFTSQISTSVNNHTKTYHLQMDLVKGLVIVKLLLECHASRAKYLYYVSEECKRGLKSLSGIYESGKTKFLVKNANCLSAVGVPDAVTLQEMESMITARAKNEKYQKDCILNNPAKKNYACWLMKHLYKNNAIASKMGLTLVQVQHLTNTCPQTLSPADEAQICFFKSLGVPVQTIKKRFFPKASLNVIQAVPCS